MGDIQQNCKQKGFSPLPTPLVTETQIMEHKTEMVSKLRVCKTVAQTESMTLQTNNKRICLK